MEPITEYIQLAQTNPAALLATLQTTVAADPMLTFAIEALGYIEDPMLQADAVQAAARFLQHSSPVIREGAIYALGALGGRQARQLLEDRALHEPHRVLRQAAHECLDDLK